jgi:hypothetical protein
MRNNSTVRVKIAVHDPWLTRMQAESRDAFDSLHAGWVRAKQLLCGLRGHRYELKVQQRRLSLHCSSCEHCTVGWDLSDRTPKLSGSPDRPRYLELLRRRG